MNELSNPYDDAKSKSVYTSGFSGKANIQEDKDGWMIVVTIPVATKDAAEGILGEL